jgi:3alpha(or 20beta)-hydroxysteroid dehydrogenase
MTSNHGAGSSVGPLTAKVVIVTGGASGQGAAEAALFADNGAHVVVADLDPPGEEAAKRLRNTVFEQHDVCSERDWARLVRATVDRFGRIDALVNNAGIVGPGSIFDLDMSRYARVIATNQTGPLLGMRAVVPHMQDAGGSIVNVSSTAGLTGTHGIVPYAASKWALRGISKSVAIEVAPFNIRVNTIVPGRIDTPLLATAVPDRKGAARAIPLGRIGTAAEVARLALYLVSDDSSFCTGADFVIDGGHTSQLP